jgi:hydrogenase maturation protease
MTRARILIAGVGNIFLGDDAFGVEIARQLAARPRSPEVKVIDFGIRGFDLAYALLDGYETVILVDATPRGHAPGTLYLIEPEISQGEATLETHAMDPVKVLRFAGTLGDCLPRVLLVGCEPQPLVEEPDMQAGMSDAVRAAVVPAISMIESLIGRLLANQEMRQQLT